MAPVKLRVIPRFPSQVLGTDGITVTRNGNVFTFSLDSSGLGDQLGLDLAGDFTTVTDDITLTAQAGGSSVTLPATGTLATLAGTETLTNKTLTAPVITGVAALAAGVQFLWDGDVGISHTTNVLSFTGASLGYRFDALVAPTTSGGAALGAASLPWGGAYFSSGSFLDFGNGDIIVTHSSNTITLTGGTLTLPNAGLVIGASVPFSDSAGTLTLQNVDALDATTESTIEAAIDTLANLTSIQGHTVTLTGALVRSGAHSLTITTTGTTTVTFPTSGTLLAGALGATDNAVLRADGTGGLTAQGSPMTVADTTGEPTWPGAAFASYTPTVTATTGTFTTVSATGAWIEHGKFVKFRATITITTIGTAAGRMLVSLPTGTVVAIGAGQSVGLNGGTGQPLMGLPFFDTNTTISVVKTADASFPGTTGQTLYVSGWYEKS